jgi:1-acyl-sn-glycerol-3-phosphate acyltransferase
MLAAVFLFPLLRPEARDAMIGFWSRILLVALGVRLQVRHAQGCGATPGEVARADTGSVLLLNHVSWLDIFVLAAVIPVRFVSKSEVAQWPIFGRLAVAVGTIFVERGRRHAVAAATHALAHRLQTGQSIAFFPEGTTTEGDHILRFHANLVQPAIDMGASVRPVGIRYTQDGELSKAPAYAGDTTMGESLWSIVRAPRLTVDVHWLAPIPTDGLRRQEVGNQARTAILAALGMPDHEPLVFHPEKGLSPPGGANQAEDDPVREPQ